MVTNNNTKRFSTLLMDSEMQGIITALCDDRQASLSRPCVLYPQWGDGVLWSARLSAQSYEKCQIMEQWAFSPVFFSGRGKKRHCLASRSVEHLKFFPNVF